MNMQFVIGFAIGGVMGIITMALVYRRVLKQYKEKYDELFKRTENMASYVKEEILQIFPQDEAEAEAKKQADAGNDKS